MAASDAVWIVSSLRYAYLHTHSSKYDDTNPMYAAKKIVVLANNVVTVVV